MTIRYGITSRNGCFNPILTIDFIISPTTTITVCKFRLDIFYSRLGNQQYNHVPIKLPTAGKCDFITNLHNNYAEIAKFVVNFPEKGECPIKIREMYIFDTETPNELVPQGVIKIGLWKGLVRCYLHAKEVINYSFVLKAIED